MVDKIKPLKIEDPISGTESNIYPTEADPTEDYTAVKGVSFENQDNRLLDMRGTGEIYVTDSRGTFPIPQTTSLPDFIIANDLSLIFNLQGGFILG